MPVKVKKTLSASRGKRKLPAWITDHFEECLNSHERLIQIIEISARGIGVLRGMPKVIELLAKTKEPTKDLSANKRIERAQKEAALATSEVDKGFPILHGFAVVALWSWMEHFVKGVVALWLLHRRDALNAPAAQKLRIRLGDYLQLQKAEQAQFLVELLEQDLASPLKRGAGRFESILEPFGLSFPLPNGCAQALFELQQIRNAITHRNGRADRRLRSDCPWLKLKMNQPVQVSHLMVGKYSDASVQFLLGLLYHIGDIYGLDLRDEEMALSSLAEKQNVPQSQERIKNAKTRKKAKTVE